MQEEEEEEKNTNKQYFRISRHLILPKLTKKYENKVVYFLPKRPKD